MGIGKNAGTANMTKKKHTHTVIHKLIFFPYQQKVQMKMEINLLQQKANSFLCPIRSFAFFFFSNFIIIKYANIMLDGFLFCI